MTVQTPERSLEQRRSALRHANEIRTHRARQKRYLRDGRVTIADLMADPLCDTMKVIEALLAVPKLGRVKASRLLTYQRISPSKTFGGLSDRQRDALLEALS